MKLKAIGKRIIIKQNLAETTTASGLVIPEAAQEKPQEGVVVSIGDVEDVKVGDTVIYSKYGATHITNDGENFIICEIKDVLAVVK